ncbi:hypothetical protein [Sporofaciens sp. SGI.106]|uniref:hypothetical protein n=1 Tax=Sporofaciens sp. SGI.106 TaxID=3420568 RepID=UPI002A971A4B|nr:hypothetical protein [Lachnoclostridium sp.]
MRNTILRNIGIIIGVIIGLIVILVIGALVYFRYFAFVPDKGGMEATYFLLKVNPYNSGTDEFGKSVGYGTGESRDYEIANGDVFYEDFNDTLVQNPKESEIPNMIGLLFKVISLDEDKVTLLINQEERTVMYGEEFVVYSLLEVRDGASTGYRMQITP